MVLISPPITAASQRHSLDSNLIIMRYIALIVIGVFASNLCHAITMPPEAVDYLRDASVTEFGTLTGSSKQVDDFVNFVKENWEDILAEVDTVASDGRKQLILVAAAEFLTPADYISFLSGLLDQYQAGKVMKSTVEYAMEGGVKKYGFLAFNYQHPAVRALCERGQMLFAAEAEALQLMTDILSGEQRKQMGAALASENRPAPETLPAP